MKKICGKKGDLLESTLAKWLFAIILAVVLIAIIYLAKGKMLEIMAKLKDSLRFGTR